MPGARSAENLADRVADALAIAVLLTVALVAAVTFRDYGLGWDDYTHSQYGDLLLKLYASGFADARALSFVNLYKYGGGFDMAAALAAKVLPFDLFETRRLIGAAIGIVGLFATWRLGRRLGGPVAGCAALILLAACPLFYGHMFINPKDAPFATAMAVLLLGIARALDEYPKPSVRTVALLGLGLGLAFGSRVLAAVAAPYALAALVLIVATEWKNIGWNAAQRATQFIWIMLPALALGYLIMGLLWPWSIVSPLNPLDAAEYFDKFFEKPWKELFHGKLISVPDMPISYLPQLFALKLPIIMLVLALIGLAGIVLILIRGQRPLNRRAAMLALALAVLLPVVLAMISHPAFYNGLRHFVFIVPPVAVAGGLAFGFLFDRARVYGAAQIATVCAVLLAGISLPLVEMVRLHPYQYVSFNAFAGGVRGAQHNFMLDYWGVAFKQAADELRSRLAAGADHPPKGRKWIVAICGPQLAAQQVLGPEFETTFNEKQADFAMAVGAYYCEYLKAPIIAEIAREGVTFARVYDLRGGPTPKLLTEPPP
ncbi:MAG: glycosyltransferase family 39 protein [Pseudolabrys sp.]|nr:glycosyltransferase family 39 protein [Pseudolabrys sp.]MDP2298094.1 glycosyltransferase family 39 protein [Pseudolabrys sp.]